MIINDPVHGFIEIEKGLINDLVRHPVFVRLYRIKQLGPTAYVYPGGCHTRFSHSIGAFHLMTEALQTLRRKGVAISEEEWTGARAAMLLHDIGHGPMSHCLEGMFFHHCTHEQITLALMKRLNEEVDGRLQPAISIFLDKYEKHFLHELVCSQLDMDRLDYLQRDSFFAGVREGNIGAQRIIKMLNVKDDRLVVEAKGIYTIENYLMSRRLMYWQVYLHKTALAAQEALRTALERAAYLASKGAELRMPQSLRFFLYNKVDKEQCAPRSEAMDNFLRLDDSDILSALKEWTQGGDPETESSARFAGQSQDRILSHLASNFINRHLYKAYPLREPLDARTLIRVKRRVADKLGITPQEADYFVRPCTVGQMLYSTTDDHISILMKNGEVRDISAFSELLHSQMVDRRSEHRYLFVDREADCGDILSGAS